MTKTSIYYARRATSTDDRLLRARSPSHSTRSPWIAMTLLLGLIAHTQLQASHTETYFAEPHTGEKVESYQVSLPVAPGESRSFTVPEECGAVMEAMSEGAMRWGGPVDKRIWTKVASDCEYYAFLHRFPDRAPIQDFVSDYDFKNANLIDLVMARNCAPADTTGLTPECTPLPADIPDILSMLAVEATPQDVTDFTVAACRIRDGKFRGRVVLDSRGMRCLPDPRAPGLRLLAVDYTDVNGDGFLDAVLRLVPLGPGTSRMPMILAFTRKTPGGHFSVPFEAETDESAPNTRIIGPWGG